MRSKEVSYKSISLIENAFLKRRGNNIHVPDWKECHSYQNQTELDVLLMGSYYERLFQLEFWPNIDFNLFCLSSKLRDVLIEVFQLSPESIGVISRYELFPKSKIEVNFEFNSATHFFYGGRISPQKNIEFLVLTIFYLQLFFSKDIQLSLLGDFDNIYHKDLLNLNYVDYEKKIYKLIEDLPWPGKKPKIITGLSELEWTNQIPPRGHYFSTSTLISEDFSVAAAQVQELGLPLLLPSWGGFADVKGNNVVHFNSNLIADSHCDLKKISNDAKAFVRKMMDMDWVSTNKSNEIKSIFPTKKINLETLNEISLRNIKLWGDEIKLIQNNDFPAFIKTDIGQKMFAKIRFILSR